MSDLQGPALTREDLEKQVRQRAKRDSAFRAQLLADPKAALKAALKFELPPDVELHVVQETPSRFYLVLPVETDELTDEDLRGVAGGAGSLFMGVAGKVSAFDAFHKW